jgi:nucleoside 2-deoxyribosyltransferase
MELEMNERIKELAEQAGFVDKGSNHTAYMSFDHEKFAELIVRECLAQVDKVDVMLEDDKEKTGVAWVGYAIEKHFGVEE